MKNVRKNFGTSTFFYGVSPLPILGKLVVIEVLSGLETGIRDYLLRNGWEIRRSFSRSCLLHPANVGAPLAIAGQ